MPGGDVVSPGLSTLALVTSWALGATGSTLVSFAICRCGEKSSKILFLGDRFHWSVAS